MNGKEIIKILVQNGWEVARVKGSHHIMKKEGMKPFPVPVHGKKDLGPGLLHVIEKTSGVNLKSK
tara:strand:+ start:354 stop:548 length:195 start_codon:yes stop_codon:yes gene_type:complete